MQIIIDIPEERYKKIVESKEPVAIFRCDVAKVLAGGIPVKSGHWCKSDGHNFWECSECGSKVLSENPLKDWNFCSRCGAKMFEPQESEDKE